MRSHVRTRGGYVGEYGGRGFRRSRDFTHGRGLAQGREHRRSGTSG